MYDIIMKDYQRRKTRRQKDAFIELIQGRYPGLKVEKNGLMGSRNLVFGDPESADIVFTAHYDTVAASLFPNLVTPDRPYFRFLNMLLVISPMIIAMLLAGAVAGWLGAADDMRKAVMLGVYFLMFIITFIGGVPNPNTANDNTSGVLTLCRTMDTFTDGQRSRAAFIFFDNEEYGCVGSGAYYKAHKAAMQDKLVVNMDCVGDGDTIMLVVSKKALPIYEEKLRRAFREAGGFSIRLESAKKVSYSSDQKHFPISVAAVAMNRSKLLGLHVGRIHTKRDTVCAPENIDYLAECSAELMRNI